jgi:membrane-associated phospholipid phosphatase
MIKKIIAVFFFLLTIDCYSQSLDYRILKSINQGSLPNWDNTMKGVSLSVYPVMPITVIGIWSHGYLKKDKTMMRNGYKSAVTIGLAIAVNFGLKYIVSRPRPFVEHPNSIIKRDNVGPYSFPSGHTNAAFATATAISLSYKKWYITVPAYVYASFVGYSRMRLGVHYPSDVLGGIITGIGSGLFVWKLDKLLNKTPTKGNENE